MHLKVKHFMIVFLVYKTELNKEIVMKTIEIIFSPTGGTEKVAKVFTECFNHETFRIDLCNYRQDFSKCEINSDDIAIIAMPSFGGRAPSIAIERLKEINGNGAECVLVCVYGNRDYEDTLVEMEDTAKECGFKVVAAVSAVAQHSIFPQYASNRPDAEDVKQLKQFAEQIMLNGKTIPNIPGNRPYKKVSSGGIVPKPTKGCTSCGVCAENCPVEAISPSDFKADSKKCISCTRCVKYCPNNSRRINNAMASVVAKAIKKACSERKNNELFL